MTGAEPAKVEHQEKGKVAPFILQPPPQRHGWKLSEDPVSLALCWLMN